MVPSKIEVLRAWHAAVNDGDIDTAVGLCDPEVEIGGPQGTGTGRDRMRAWLDRSRIALEPQAEFVEEDGRFVVPELARWRSDGAPSAVPSEEAQQTWVAFVVGDGHVRSVRRYESAHDAARDRPGAALSEVDNLGDGTAIYPDQATAGYPDTESGAPHEGAAGPDARPHTDA